MSSTCSSCRRRSPAIAAASSGSKPSMVMVVRNMRAAASVTRIKRGANCTGVPAKSRILFAAECSPITTSAISWGGLPQATDPPPLSARALQAEARRHVRPVLEPRVSRQQLHQVLDDRGPGLRQIGAVVATATESEHTAVTQALGEAAQVAGGAPVNLRREAQMSNGIALETVC